VVRIQMDSLELKKTPMRNLLLWPSHTHQRKNRKMEIMMKIRGRLTINLWMKVRSCQRIFGRKCVLLKKEKIKERQQSSRHFRRKLVRPNTLLWAKCMQ